MPASATPVFENIEHSRPDESETTNSSAETEVLLVSEDWKKFAATTPITFGEATPDRGARLAVNGRPAESCLDCAGRCILAARDMQDGEVLLDATLYAYVIDANMRSTTCAYCLAYTAPVERKVDEQLSKSVDEKLKINDDKKQCDGTGEKQANGAEEQEGWPFYCKGCKMVYYCSQQCQDADRLVHTDELECPILRAIDANGQAEDINDDTELRLVIRLLALRLAEMREPREPRWKVGRAVCRA